MNTLGAHSVFMLKEYPRAEVIARFTSIIERRQRNEDSSALKYWRSVQGASKGGRISEREFQIWINALRPLAQEAQIVRRVAQAQHGLVARVPSVSVSPASELGETAPGLVEHALLPVAIAEPTTQARALAHRLLAQAFVRRHEPVADTGAGGDPARAAIALVDQHDLGAFAGGSDRCPGRGGASPDHQHLGREDQGRGVGGSHVSSVCPLTRRL